MKSTLPLLLALIATPTFAQETRQADAHEHGVGMLDIAVDGGTLAMVFHAPGADIVGFEYLPESDADRATVDAAVATLSQPLSLFALPDAAGCTVDAATAELEAEGAHDDHADHDAKHDAEHGHDDHAHEHADEHHAEDGHDDHAEEHHGEKVTHTEFHAEYTLTCADPSAITAMTFPYFETFENAREVEVQIVTTTGAQAFEVPRDAPAIDLSGMF